MSYAACGSHPYKPLIQVWWTIEVRLPIFTFSLFSSTLLLLLATECDI